MVNKPYGMESQFVCHYQALLLSDIDFDFPEGIHAVGRLDKHSEGLLLLTNNKKITSLLFKSKTPHKRTYLVQVKHRMNDENLNRLRTGVPIRIKGGAYYMTPSCDVKRVEKPENLFPLPFFYPDYEETTWLLITITEGRFHQVRKMMQAVTHRCKRLIRVSIEDMLLDDLQPGCVREFSEPEFFTLLKLDKSFIHSTSLG
jgi:23S rRNA pseudouridine2457 synthase